MNRQIEIARKKLNELHNSDKSIAILYEAIEKCSSEYKNFHRDLVFDSFDDNDALPDAFEHLSDKTNFEQVIDGLVDDKVVAINEINEWIEIDYKRFVFHYLEVALKTLSELNETIAHHL